MPCINIWWMFSGTGALKPGDLSSWFNQPYGLNESALGSKWQANS